MWNRVWWLEMPGLHWETCYLCICCWALHAKFPLHCVEVWTGTHFQASSLIHVGLFIQLGHDGSTCPYPGQGTTHMSNEEDDWEDDPDDDNDFWLSDESLKLKDTCLNSNDIAAGQVITIVDISGVHRMVIQTCCCVSNRDADDIQHYKWDSWLQVIAMCEPPSHSEYWMTLG